MEPHDPIRPLSREVATGNVKGRPLPFGVPPPAVPVWPTQRGQGSDLTPEQVISSYAKTHPYSTHHATTGSGGIWSDIVNWFSAAGRTVVSGFEDISNWVLKIVRDAINLLWEDLHSVFHLVTRYGTDIFHWAEDCLVAAERLIRTVWHDAVHLLDQLRHDVAHWLDDLRHALAHDFDNIRHWIASAFDKATRTAWLFLERHVFKPLHEVVTWIHHAIDWFGRELDKAWAELYRKFIRPLVNDVKEVVSKVANLEKHVYGDIFMWIRELERAGDWILWMAEHSFHDIAELAEGSEAALVRDWLKAAPGG